MEKSRLRCGSGAVALTAPRQRSSSIAASAMPTTSSASIQDTYWRPLGDRPAHAQLEGRQHLGQRAALAVEHHAGAHLRHPHAQAPGRVGLALPSGARLREEVPARGRVLVDRLVAASAVIADRRAAHQRLRALAGRQRFDAEHQVARPEHPAVADRPLGLIAPALRDVLARQMYDGIDARQRRPGSRFSLRVPSDRLDRPAACERSLGPRRVAREDRHPLAALQERRHDPPPDQASRSAHRHPHARALPFAAQFLEGERSPTPPPLWGIPVSLSPWAKPTSWPASALPLARACSATAAATAGATSRLKTDGTM